MVKVFTIFYVQLFLLLTAPIAIACFLRVLFMYLNFKSSTYEKVTGISFRNVFLKKGPYGEFLTYKILEKIQKDFKGKILMNVYIPKENGETTEVDGIYINNTGVYVIESKNYSGWIFGSENSMNWTQSLNKRTKNQFYNPIKQNRGHISNLKKYIGEEAKENIFNSVIVFSERCELKKIDIKSTDIVVIKRNNLLSYLNKKLRECEHINSDEDVNKLYELLKPLTNVKDEDKQKHIDNINNKKIKEEVIDVAPKDIEPEPQAESNTIESKEHTIKKENNNDLYEELKAYRLKVSREQGIKPYMVFTNEQLNALSENKPKTKEELLKIKGFGDKKIEKYGDGILGVVNMCNNEI